MSNIEPIAARRVPRAAEPVGERGGGPSRGAAEAEPANTRPPLLVARGIEREVLARRIREHAAAAARLANAEQASARLSAETWRTLDPAVERAEADLAEARRRAPQRLVDRLLGAAADESLSVESANGALEKARQALTDAQAAADLLKTELRAAKAASENAKHDLDRAVAEVLQAAPEVLRLLAQYDAAQEKVIECRKQLYVIDRAFGVPRRHWQNPPLDYAIDRGPEHERWSAAIARLRTDPDAPLPT